YLCGKGGFIAGSHGKGGSSGVGGGYSLVPDSEESTKGELGSWDKSEEGPREEGWMGLLLPSLAVDPSPAAAKYPCYRLADAHVKNLVAVEPPAAELEPSATEPEPLTTEPSPQPMAPEAPEGGMSGDEPTGRKRVSQHTPPPEHAIGSSDSSGPNPNFNPKGLSQGPGVDGSRGRAGGEGAGAQVLL
ncbi:unnamed protein product, partial [Discosporangium mesarthrocarpum]